MRYEIDEEVIRLKPLRLARSYRISEVGKQPMRASPKYFCGVDSEPPKGSSFWTTR